MLYLLHHYIYVFQRSDKSKKNTNMIINSLKSRQAPGLCPHPKKKQGIRTAFYNMPVLLIKFLSGSTAGNPPSALGYLFLSYLQGIIHPQAYGIAVIARRLCKYRSENQCCYRASRKKLRSSSSALPDSVSPAPAPLKYSARQTSCKAFSIASRVLWQPVRRSSISATGRCAKKSP